MPKPLCPYQVLQQLAYEVVRQLASGRAIVPVVRHKSNQIVRDEEYRDIGRAPWCCDYFVSPDDPSARALIPTLKAAMAPYQALYDLGVVCG
jgi:hypothetical protein